MQAVLQIVKDFGGMDEEVGHMPAGNHTLRPRSGTLHLPEGIFQLLNVITGVCHGLLQLLLAGLLFAKQFFFSSNRARISAITIFIPLFFSFITFISF